MRKYLITHIFKLNNSDKLYCNNPNISQFVPEMFTFNYILICALCM